MSARPSLHRTTLTPVLALLMAATCAGSLAAQAHERVSPTTGSTVRVERTDGTELRGTVVRLDPDSVVISKGPDEDRVVAREEVRELWVGERKTASAMKGGAVLGGLVGVAGSLLYMEWVCAELSCSGSSLSASVVLQGAALGTLAGTLVGAAIGSMSFEWRPVDRP